MIKSNRKADSPVISTRLFLHYLIGYPSLRCFLMLFGYQLGRLPPGLTVALYLQPTILRQPDHAV
jgi:hypothetical protein